jgi:hypothetical protein
MAHHHLAAALVQIEEGEDGLSVRNAAVEAARSCEAALRVRTREASPLDWGRTQYVLGQAVLRASGTTPAPGHANALRAFRAASEIFCANDHPQEHQLIAAQIERTSALLDSASNGR